MTKLKHPFFLTLISAFLLMSAPSCALTFTVTFETNGGSLIAAQKVKKNTLVERPKDPVKSNAEFSGWYQNKNLTTPFTFNERVTSDITLYADYISLKKPTVDAFLNDFDAVVNGVINMHGTDNDYYISVNFTFTFKNISKNNYLNFDLTVDFIWILYGVHDNTGELFENQKLVGVSGASNKVSEYQILKTGHRPAYAFSTYDLLSFDVAATIKSIT